MAENVDMAQIKQFPCTQCTKIFNSAQALRSHAAKMHNARCPVALRIRDNVCPSCNKIFSNRYFNLTHIRRSVNRCKPFVLNNCDILEQEVFTLVNIADNKLINGNVRAGLPKHFAGT